MLEVQVEDDNLTKLIDDDIKSEALSQPYKIFSDLPSEPVSLAMSRLDGDHITVIQPSTGEHVTTLQAQGDGPEHTYVPIHLAADGSTGLQTLTMTNVNTTCTGSSSSSSSSAAAAAPTVLQYAAAAQGTDGQLITIPVSALSGGGNTLTYQVPAASVPGAGATGSSMGQNIVLAAPASHTAQATTPMSEEAKRKRELRLMKNREAAHECRRKKKDYIKCLENRVALLENQNKTLIEELKSLKELYCQKEAG